MSRTSQKPKYTSRIDIPHYHPTGETPDISELIDESRTSELISGIDASNVSREERSFLAKAAYRHLAFNYKKIAEYYANADKEMQALMEKSALVIVDYDDAIQYGYAKLSKRMEELRKADAR